VCLSRWIKALCYPMMPSIFPRWHDKRRKGLAYRHVPAGILECQTEQDRIFWKKFLHPEGGGRFLEIGAGDGVTGSHSLGLELSHGWRGGLWEPALSRRDQSPGIRQCDWLVGVKEPRLDESHDLLLAIHRPFDFSGVWDQLSTGRLKPGWVIIENREPDPQWCRLLERSGYRLRFFFHDDEYYELKP